MNSSATVPTRERYRRLRRLGEGGSGVVWLVHDRRLRRKVALKELRGDARDPRWRERLEREARVTAAIEHPHLVRLLDFEVQEESPWLLYEYVEGGTLAERLDADGLPSPGEGLSLAAGIAEGLAALHAEGVLHRDLKPGNVLLRANDDPVVADLGFALSEREPEVLTRTGEILGTPWYLAPECWKGAPPTEASDRFSLGAVLLELLFGARAFPDLPLPELFQLVHRGVRIEVPRRAGIPEAVAVLVEDLCDADPDRRPEDSEEVARGLRRWGAPSRSMRIRPARPAGSPLAPGPAAAGLVGLVIVGGLLLHVPVAAPVDRAPAAPILTPPDPLARPPPATPAPRPEPEEPTEAPPIFFDDPEPRALQVLRTFLREDLNRRSPGEEHVTSRARELLAPELPALFGDVLEDLADRIEGVVRAELASAARNKTLSCWPRVYALRHVLQDAQLLATLRPEGQARYRELRGRLIGMLEEVDRHVLPSRPALHGQVLLLDLESDVVPPVPVLVGVAKEIPRIRKGIYKNLYLELVRGAIRAAFALAGDTYEDLEATDAALQELIRLLEARRLPRGVSRDQLYRPLRRFLRGLEQRSGGPSRALALLDEVGGSP